MSEESLEHDVPIPPMSDEKLIETARGIVTGQLMIADLERHEWQSSLALMASALVKCPNLGMILVPLEPHQNGLWINGIAPGLVLAAQTVAREDLERLGAEVKRMTEALYPSPPTTPLEPPLGTKDD